MIPLLFIGIAAGTGALGVGKSVKAGIDQKDAKDTTARARRIVNQATDKINTCRENCKTALSDLGEQKVYVLDISIKPFIEEFEKLKNVDMVESEGLDELQKLVLDQKSFAQLKQVQAMASSMVGGMASGAVAGALTAFGAYGAAGALATASTGTAIASLSGAAATNATLAFFGGGSLAAGGLGMAGGTAVLGGLVAGPALAVLGFVVGAKASANKDKAYENLAQAKVFREEMDAAAVLCIGIRKRSAMFERFLLSLNAVLEPLAYEMKQIIASKETDAKGKVDARGLSADEWKIIAKAMSIAGAVKAILDTPILDDDGNLTAESERIAKQTQQKIGQLMEPAS